MTHRSLLPFCCALGMLAALAATSCDSQPVNQATARAELQRVLEIWLSGKYYVTPRVSSAPGKDISGFFDPDLYSRARLKAYKIVSGKESKAGEYEFVVSVVLELFTTLGGPREGDKIYYVFKGKKNRWLVVDARMKAELDKWRRRK